MEADWKMYGKVVNSLFRRQSIEEEKLYGDETIMPPAAQDFLKLLLGD